MYDMYNFLHISNLRSLLNMAGVSTIYIIYLGFFLVSLTQDFLFSFLIMLRFKSRILFKKQQGLFIDCIVNYSSQLLLLFGMLANLFTLRVSKSLWIIPFDLVLVEYLLVITIFFILRSFWTSRWGDQTSTYYDHIFTILCLVVFILNAAENVLLFIIAVECIAALYYFFFLQRSPRESFSAIRYKNLLSLYLWLSFFTLFLFIVGTLILIDSYGTLEFSEIKLFSEEQFILIILMLGFFWKIGMPGFHFFKFELYRYLPTFDLVLFSTLTLVFNFFIIFIFLCKLFPALITSYTLVFLSLLSNVFLILAGSERLNLFTLLALSSLNTWALAAIVLFS